MLFSHLEVICSIDPVLYIRYFTDFLVGHKKKIGNGFRFTHVIGSAGSLVPRMCFSLVDAEEAPMGHLGCISNLGSYYHFLGNLGFLMVLMVVFPSSWLGFKKPTIDV